MALTLKDPDGTGSRLEQASVAPMDGTATAALPLGEASAACQVEARVDGIGPSNPSDPIEVRGSSHTDPVGPCSQMLDSLGPCAQPNARLISVDEPCVLEPASPPPDPALVNVAVNCALVSQGTTDADGSWSLDGDTLTLTGALCDRVPFEGVELSDLVYGCPTVE